jgi:hypothetical protein
VKSLSASVKTLKSGVATLSTRADCFGAQGVVQWVNPAAGQDYIYTNDGDATLIITTAFDFPASDQTPTFYAATVNPSCVTGSQSRAFRSAAWPKRTRRPPFRAP